jgi:exosortase E/protease (VPEID-CTERM system)
VSDAAVNINHQIPIRLVALAALLLAQLMIISLGFDANQRGLASSGEWFGFLSYSGQFAKILVAALVFSALVLWPRLPNHLDAIQRSVRHYPHYRFAVIQLVSYALFLWCTYALFGERARFDNIPDSLVAAWLVTLATTAVFWLLALAPWSYWRELIATEAKVLLAALVVGVLAWVLATFSQTLWTPLSDLTFRLSAILLGQMYPEIFVDPELKRLGAQEFVVSIAPACSGYEGMGLMAIFTGFYLSVFRKDFRFPQAFWLFPIGIVTIWLFNNIRIAALIAIGASFSPDVAIGGFHSQAGWISFIVVIVLTLSLAYRIPYFSTVPATLQASRRELNLPMALLIPFITLLAATILTSALSADFDWLYPLRVIAVALALALCWRFYRFSRLKFNLEPWLAGLVVFGLWIVLVPDDPSQNMVFETQLFDASTVVIVMWLLLRSLGAIITVPLAEELLFRGYLLSRLARQEVSLEGRIAFSWVALVVSSVLFGLLHSNWVAGIAAGLIYGWVRYRSSSIKDAVIAHACTNLLLTFYVLSTGQWSLW